MAMKIGTFNPGVTAFDKSTRAQEKNMAQISAGLRILSGADDAAGLAIATEQNADVRSTGQAYRNLADGVSMTQVADGAMGEVSDMLGRMKELSVQASNGTLNHSQRAMINDEFQSLKSQVDRIAGTTEFNGTSLLDGSQSSVELQSGPNPGDRIAVNLQNTDAQSLGMAATDLSTAEGARNAMGDLDGAISSLSGRRTDLGALQNRLEHTMTGLSSHALNTEAARSRIEDLDYAQAISEQVSEGIRTQAAAATAAQSNQQSANVLSLLPH